MNRDEAEYVLRSYHLGGRDVDDPQFRDALELLKRDAELQTWFFSERAADHELSKAFCALPVPPRMKSDLLALRKVVPERAWWQKPSWITAMAASVALLGILSVLLRQVVPGHSFADFQSYVVETTAKLDHLDIHTSEMARIREWLREHRAPDDFSIPGKLNGKSTVGCRVFSWKGQKVSLVCLEVPDNKVAHLFVLDRSALTNWPEGSPPQIETTNSEIATAAWSDSKRVYVVTLERGGMDLRRLLL